MESRVLAFVGMSGSGKSEAVSYLKKIAIPFVRFGQLTEEEAKARNLPLTPENEQMLRESLRKEHGFDIYAVKAKPAIEALLKDAPLVSLDGLYSWEEYKFLRNAFTGLTIVHIYATRKKRYERLSVRTVRPFTLEQARERDTAEIENIHKAGPIAIADYLIENSGDDIALFHQKIDALILQLQTK